MSKNFLAGFQPNSFGMSYLFSNKYRYTKRVVKFIEHSSQPLKYRTDKKWLLEKCFVQYRTTFAEYLALIELLIFSVILQNPLFVIGV